MRSSWITLCNDRNERSEMEGNLISSELTRGDRRGRQCTKSGQEATLPGSGSGRQQLSIERFPYDDARCVKMISTRDSRRPNSTMARIIPMRNPGSWASAYVAPPSGLASCLFVTLLPLHLTISLCYNMIRDPDSVARALAYCNIGASAKCLSSRRAHRKFYHCCHAFLDEH